MKHTKSTTHYYGICPATKVIFNIVVLMQKYFDLAISGNWSYNPTQFENNEVP